MTPAVGMIILGALFLLCVVGLVILYGSARKQVGAATQQVEQSKADSEAAKVFNKEMATGAGALGKRLRKSQQRQERLQKLKGSDK